MKLIYNYIIICNLIAIFDLCFSTPSLRKFSLWLSVIASKLCELFFHNTQFTLSISLSDYFFITYIYILLRDAMIKKKSRTFNVEKLWKFKISYTPVTICFSTSKSTKDAAHLLLYASKWSISYGSKLRFYLDKLIEAMLRCLWFKIFFFF